MCKRSWRVDDMEALPYILDKAFRLAEAGCPGPVLVDVPMDMFSREMDEELGPHLQGQPRDLKPALDPAARQGHRQKLVEAKNPVPPRRRRHPASSGLRGAGRSGRVPGSPVSRTGRPGLPVRPAPLMIGQTGFWGLEFTHSPTTNADVILGLGTRFGEADSSSWYQGVTFFDPDKTTFLQIDIDPNEIVAATTLWRSALSATQRSTWPRILEEVKKICPKARATPELRAQIA